MQQSHSRYASLESAAVVIAMNYESIIPFLYTIIVFSQIDLLLNIEVDFMIKYLKYLSI